MFHENGQTDTEPQSGNCEYERKDECERISRPLLKFRSEHGVMCCGMEVPSGSSKLFVWQFGLLIGCALGLVREDTSLIERAAGRFEALGLDWHAARTRGFSSRSGSPG